MARRLLGIGASEADSTTQLVCIGSRAGWLSISVAPLEGGFKPNQRNAPGEVSLPTLLASGESVSSRALLLFVAPGLRPMLLRELNV